VSCKTISASDAKFYSSIEVVLHNWSLCKNRHFVLHTRISFFANPQFQTHDPTQPTENKYFRPTTHLTQPNPTRGSTQPMDNSGLDQCSFWHFYRVSKKNRKTLIGKLFAAPCILTLHAPLTAYNFITVTDDDCWYDCSKCWLCFAGSYGGGNILKWLVKPQQDNVLQFQRRKRSSAGNWWPAVKRDCFTPARVAYDPSATPWSRIDPKPTVSVNLVAHGLKKRKAQCMTDVYIDVGPSWSQVCIMLNISRFLLHPDNSIMVGFCEDHGSRCGYTKTTNEDFLHFCYMKTVRIKSGIS